MKILIVCSGNNGKISPFIKDQVEALKRTSISIDYYLIRGKGIVGYFKNIFQLKKKIKKYSPDLLHAHFGLSGLLANLQRKIPVITTFHGSDINIERNRYYSKLTYYLSKKSIFVSKKLAAKLSIKNPKIIPCGVNLNIFSPKDKEKCREILKLNNDKKYILFSSSFNNKIKNYGLAKEAVSKLAILNVELLELKGYNRNEVALLMNAVDLALMTSFSEGSPQFIKEAMASNLPIVSTDVGDVKEIIFGIEGCFITSFDSADVAEKIDKAITFSKRINGRENISYLNEEVIADEIMKIYEKCRK